MADFNRGDLDFILRQIRIAEDHRTREGIGGAPVAGTPLDQLIVDPHLPFGLRTVDGRYNNIIPGREEFGAADTVFPRMLEPNFLPGYDTSTSPNHIVTDSQPRTISNLIVDQTLDNIAAISASLFHLGLDETTTRNLSIEVNGLWNDLKSAQATFVANGSTENEEARDAAKAALDTALAANGIELTPKFKPAGSPPVAVLDDYGSLVIANLAPDEGISAPFNSWMTLFGQFFDHGLDLVTKGQSGTVFIPLLPGDPLYNPNSPSTNFMALTRATNQPGLDGIVGTSDDIREHTNTTTSWVDQNQTYTSHSSHQVFLREYMTDGSTGDVYTTGKLLDGVDGTMPTWGEIKQQALKLGIILSDADVTNVPLLATDEYGRFLRGADGFAQVVVRTYNPTTYNPVDPTTYTDALVSANDPLAPLDLKAIDADPTKEVVRTGHAFLDDIAHSAGPRDQAGNMKIADGDGIIGTTTVTNAANFVQGFTGTETWLLEKRANVVDNPNYTGPAIDGSSQAWLDHLANVLQDGNGNGLSYTSIAVADRPFVKTSEVYDEELLARHFVTGDGRGNENIGLTTVHHVFHSEHNRMAEQTKDLALAAAVAGDIAFLNEWLRTDIAVTTVIPDPTTQATEFATFVAGLEWDGERLFQSARFGTEMQYQHLVFEEFGRKVVPAIDLFVFNPTLQIDPSIVAEFAHVVYRFGHSMLNETVDRVLDQNTQDQMSLVEAFLNPLAFNNSSAANVDPGMAGLSAAEAAGAIVRGMTQQRGNAIDEYVTDALRNFLVGVPLDLPALNIARGRDTGVPTLNAARTAFFAESNSEWVRPYDGWSDFKGSLKNPLSVVNFIAAYGTHESLSGSLTSAEKRDAAIKLVFGDGITAGGVTIRGEFYSNANVASFLGGTGAYASNRGGMDDVDLWVGGLAEATLPFGGMLGATFTYVFEKQMENLQNADRFYYLSRTQGMHFLNELESNSFAELIANNVDLKGAHLPGEVFSNPNWTFEINEAVQADYNGGTRADGLDPDGVDVQRGINVTIDATTYEHYLHFTGGEHVVLGGTDLSDALIGGIGDDALWGDGGDDVLKGDNGVNRLHGGDGNDLIYDGGDAAFLHGEGGDDYISAGAGVGDLIFGDAGNDFIVMGDDAKEAFAGEGNDFVYGTKDVDVLLGGEGDDWLEGGEGFDTTAGDNSELFFNSSIIGHDVMFSGTNEHDFDSESGDDIMVQGEGIMRSEGMFGFDWSIYKGNALAANADLRIKLENNAPQNVLRNRHDRVEALSGWDKNDALFGDDRVAPPPGPFDPNNVPVENDFTGDWLDRAGVERISGLRELLGLSQSELNAFALADTVYNTGNVLIGGKGSDRIQGGGGNDVIDGDKWLNVRIGIVFDGIEVGSLERISPREVLGTNTPRMDLITVYAEHMDDWGHLNGLAITSAIEQRFLTGSNMKIVREILDGGVAGDLDTAIFRGNRATYTLSSDGDATIVTHVPPVGIGFDDGVDRLTGIERLKFADVAITSRVASENWTGDLMRVPNEITAPTTWSLSGADASKFTVVSGMLRLSTGVNFELPSDTNGDGIYEVSVTQQNTLGVTFVDQVRLSITNVSEAVSGSFAIQAVNPNGVQTSAAITALDQRVDNDVASSTNPGGAVSAVASYQWERRDLTLGSTNWSAVAGATSQTITGVSGGVYRLRSTYTDPFGTTVAYTGEVLVGTSANQSLVSNGANEVLYGLAGADTLNGGLGADTMFGGLGSDAYFVDNVGDVVSEAGGSGTDLVNASVSIDMTTWTGVENLTLSGTSSLTGTGNTGNNAINGNSAANVLAGAAGNDTVNGNGGDDRFVASAGDGNDTYNGGAGTADVLDLSATTAGATVNLHSAIYDGAAANRASSAQIGTDVLSNIETVIGTSGNDTIVGSSASNVISGGAGNDALRGFTGIDTFVFAGVFGNDTIADFHRTYNVATLNGFSATVRDVLDLSGMTNRFANFADLAAHTTVVGSDIVISAKTTSAAASGGFGSALDLDAANTVTLQGLTQANFMTLATATNDFIF